MNSNLGNLFIIAAPSGAGKSSLVNALINQQGVISNDACAPSVDSNATHSQIIQAQKSVQLSISHTTRPPRPGETDGVEYHFVNHQEFQEMIKQDAFYEYAEVFGNYYGTSKTAIADKLSLGIDVFLDIDWQGARQIKQQTKVCSVFILPPSKEELRTRLKGRGQDSDSIIEGRMAEAVSEMSHFDEFDFVIFNDDFELALSQLTCIVESRRLSCGAQNIRHQDLLKDLLEA